MNAKKLVSMILALVMLLALGTSAMADTETGSITISNAQVNVEYKIYKVFDLTFSGSENSNVSYTYTKSEGTDELFEALNGDDSPFTLTQVGETSVYNVTLKNDKTTGEAIGTWLKENEGKLTATKAQIATTTSVVFTPVDYGYYYATSSMGTAIAVNSAKPEVTIQDKNEVPTIGKKVKEGSAWVDENDANIGDTVEFKADIAVKTGAKKYVMHDTMAAGLTLDTNSIKVMDGETPVAAENYTVNTSCSDGCTFEVTFSDDYIKMVENKTITVYYNATLNENAVIDGNGNENKTKLNYGDTVNVDHDNNPDTPDVPKTPETAEDKTVTYTYAIALKKVDKNGKALAGAKFQFPFYVNETAGADGAYVYAGTEAGEGKTNTITTPENGEILIKGVEAGEYSITETEAPVGYNKLTSAISVTAEKTQETATNVTFYLNENGEVVDQETETTVTFVRNIKAAVIVAVNLTGATLPSTGGMGTTVLYIAGGLLVAAAVIMMITKRRAGAAE